MNPTTSVKPVPDFLPNGEYRCNWSGYQATVTEGPFTGAIVYLKSGPRGTIPATMVVKDHQATVTEIKQEAAPQESAYDYE
jgi:hypothetical protein